MSSLLSFLLGLDGLFDGGQVDTGFLGEGDSGVLALTDDENVADSGGEVVSSGISNVDNIETTHMSVSGGQNTDSTNIVTLNSVDELSSLEFNEVQDLSALNVDLDGVVDIDIGVGVSDGSTVVGDNVWDFIGADFSSDDLAKLELSFIRLDGSEDESTLDVVQDSEVFTSLSDGDNIHETSGEFGVSSDLSVNEDVGFLVSQDVLSISGVQSILKTLLEDDRQRNAVSQFVGTLGGSGSENTTELVKHPSFGGSDSLQMLLGTSCHFSMLKSSSICRL
mmetsp:Transcript_10517/g.9060  ORF Transcript_10517/g.9060 Transcript_10517/m.9060 type:complete len:279 (+) Transcript_10517:481-1317(+)